jgi:hypothetical protein
MVIDTEIEPDAILSAIDAACRMTPKPVALFGEGKSDEMFHRILKDPQFWLQPTQKFFVDRVFG